MNLITTSYKTMPTHALDSYKLDQATPSKQVP